MSQKDNYISALCKELSDRKEFLKNDIIETVYFGGGTPSQLSGNDFEKIFDQLNKHYNLANIKEVTIEINPDDINEEYITMAILYCSVTSSVTQCSFTQMLTFTNIHNIL